MKTAKITLMNTVMFQYDIAMCSGDGPRTAAATARAEAISAENAALTSYLEQNPTVLESFARDLLPLMLEVRRTADGSVLILPEEYCSYASLRWPQLTMLVPTLCNTCMFTQLAYHLAESLSRLIAVVS